MKELLRCREQEALCRQRAALDPTRRWHWLAEAEKWQHKALAEISSRFADCNTTAAAEPHDVIAADAAW